MTNGDDKTPDRLTEIEIKLTQLLSELEHVKNIGPLKEQIVGLEKSVENYKFYTGITVASMGTIAALVLGLIGWLGYRSYSDLKQDVTNLANNTSVQIATEMQGNLRTIIDKAEKEARAVTDAKSNAEENNKKIKEILQNIKECPAGWTDQGKFCYSPVEQPNNANTANRLCAEKTGAHICSVGEYLTIWPNFTATCGPSDSPCWTNNYTLEGDQLSVFTINKREAGLRPASISNSFGYRCCLSKLRYTTP